MSDTRDEILTLLHSMAGGEVLEVGGAGEYHILECLTPIQEGGCFQLDNGDCLDAEDAADQMVEIGGVWDYVEIPDEDDDYDAHGEDEDWLNDDDDEAFHDPDSYDLDDEAFGDGSPL